MDDPGTTSRSPIPASLVDLRGELRAIHNRTTTLSPADLAALRKSVRRVVHEMKHDGILPERIIVTVRQAMAEARVASSSDRLLELLVKWCIEEYYGSSSTGDTAR